ncbi:MAG: hypothetical protein US88_C0002G0029 [Parcubacteria group bacterium GW2011_GWA2_38_27]|nr:MAG: hypothetical protein US88_C0002G0029 [Parcubacteria group bacterium GW2011_GWA2_38_27]
MQIQQKLFEISKISKVLPKNPEVSDSREDFIFWLASLSPEDRQDFNFVFGD